MRAMAKVPSAITRETTARLPNTSTSFFLLRLVLPFAEKLKIDCDILSRYVHQLRIPIRFKWIPHVQVIG